jgi:hypothetical protein
MMMKIEIPGLPAIQGTESAETISGIIDSLGAQGDISVINWPSFSYSPVVEFRTAYTKSHLFIKYYVSEKYTSAVKRETNSNVFEDSCVEFFVAPQAGSPYYNFEFNPCGVCLAAIGADRHNRVRQSPEKIAEIVVHPSLGKEPFSEREGDNRWNLLAGIPFGLMGLSPERVMPGLELRANFYKCGDKLTEPHYLTWSQISTPAPDYHRPEFFGKLIFR